MEFQLDTEIEIAAGTIISQGQTFRARTLTRQTSQTLISTKQISAGQVYGAQIS